jgi:hypothetical protein
MIGSNKAPVNPGHQKVVDERRTVRKRTRWLTPLRRIRSAEVRVDFAPASIPWPFVRLN